MPRQRVTPAASVVHHDSLSHEGQGYDEPVDQSESPDASASPNQEFPRPRVARECSGCSDGVKRSCGCGRCYCCSRAALDDFMQQRMSAWEPLLTPRRILFVLFGVGVVFLVLGLVILLVNSGIVECKVNYTDMVGDLILKIDASTCTDTSITEITGDVLLYYELSNYFQNHRHFMKSRSDKQLEGKVYTAASDVRTACDPRVESLDGRVLHPCGLSAGAVFTDVFSAVGEDQMTEIELDESREAICWDWDLSTFKNPSEEEMNAAASQVDFWLFNQTYATALHMDKPEKPLLFAVDTASSQSYRQRQALLNQGGGGGGGGGGGHCQEAPLPVFRKVYARFVAQSLKLPFYLKVTNNTYDVKSFGGSKSVVVTQASWLGGRTSFLGIAYLVVGSVCLLFFGVLFYYHRRNPRHLGDVSWLRKALYS